MAARKEAYGRGADGPQRQGLPCARADPTKSTSFKCCRFGRSPRGPLSVKSVLVIELKVIGSVPEPVNPQDTSGVGRRMAVCSSAFTLSRAVAERRCGTPTAKRK